MSDHRAPSAFDAPAMAAGYAAYRPAVHAPVMARAVAHLECSVPVARVLDVGCGAGLSTRAALPWAGSVVGVDPSAAMITAARRAVPAARFAVGAGERLPVGRGTVDVVTAAGSLDFIDLDRFAREAARVLRPDGAIVAYDFATGSRCAEAPGLAVVAAEFARRWPRPTRDRVAIDPQVLRDGPFEVQAVESLVVTLPMGLDEYVNYLMTETNVADAVHRGMHPSEIRVWCVDALAPVLTVARPVEFDAWFAVVRPRAVN